MFYTGFYQGKRLTGGAEVINIQKIKGYMNKGRTQFN